MPQHGENYVLGVDIGGTRFRVGLVDKDGNLLKHSALATSSINSASGALRELAAQVDPDHRAKIVVAGVPGVVDYLESKVIFAPNIPQAFIAELTGQSVSKVLERKALIVNDADLAGVGEAYFGAGTSAASLAYVTISTGVGAAVVINKKLLRTRHSLAELGHSFIHAGHANADGQGSVEFEASGTALARLAKESGVKFSNEELVKAAESGDPQARPLVEQLARNAGAALANMVHLFSIEALILGGGVILSGDFIFNLVVANFNDLKPRYLDVEVRRAALGDDVALIGAAGAFSALDIS